MLTYFIDAITDPPRTALGGPTPFVMTSFCTENFEPKGCHVYRVRLRNALRDLCRFVGRKARVMNLTIHAGKQFADITPGTIIAMAHT